MSVCYQSWCKSLWVTDALSRRIKATASIASVTLEVREWGLPAQLSLSLTHTNCYICVCVKRDMMLSVSVFSDLIHSSQMNSSSWSSSRTLLPLNIKITAQDRDMYIYIHSHQYVCTFTFVLLYHCSYRNTPHYSFHWSQTCPWAAAHKQSLTLRIFQVLLTQTVNLFISLLNKL